MLTWMCGKTRKDGLRNEYIRAVGVAPIKDQVMENRLRWDEHAQPRSWVAPVGRGTLVCMEGC